MATRTSASINFSPGDDATFRAFTTEMSTGLQAAGMVKTADTGQIDHATVLRATAANQSRGYEIYRFADALQTAATNPDPVFFKIEYGSGTTGWLTQVAIWITVGSGSDGAGNITGVTAPRQYFSGPANSTANYWQGPCYWSGDGSGFRAVIGDQASRPWMVMNFERTRNPTDGTAVGEGVLFYIWQGEAYGVNNTHHFLMYPTNGRTEAGNWARNYGLTPLTQIVPHGISTGIVGTDVYMWPQFASYPSLYPHMGLYTYAAQDVVRLTEFPMTTLGVSRTYKAFDWTSYSVVPGIVGATPRAAYALRWE